MAPRSPRISAGGLDLVLGLVSAETLPYPQLHFTFESL